MATMSIAFSKRSKVPEQQNWGTPDQTFKIRRRDPRVPRTLAPLALSTYINKVRQVVDVVLEDRCIGGFQGQ